MSVDVINDTEGHALAAQRVTLVQEWRENWRVGLAAFLALGFSLGAYATLTSLFVIPLQETFGWSRGQIALAHNASLVSAMISPFFGRVVDRIGPRRIMLLGMPVFACAYFGMAAMNGSLPLFYALYVMAQVAGLSSTGMTCSRVVSEAFVSSRGFSLAAARSGMALAGAILPALMYAIILHFGWRAGFLTQGLMILVFAWPAVYFWVGRSKKAVVSAPRALPKPEMPRWGSLLRQRKVWFICIGAALGYAPATSLMSQLQPLLIGKGIDPVAAASLVGLAGAASFIGALITGSLVDRFWAPGVALIFACGSAAGCVLLAQQSTLDGQTAAIAIVLIGLGLGAEIDVVAYMVARYFGVHNFSTLYGLAALFLSFSGAVGSSLLGLTYDHFGNYDPALIVMACAFISAGFIYLLLGPYPPQEHHR